ncbi:hypothetical protein [Streptomyces sp. HPF1205]|uniref:hypothetical protein n=1 Tax=Streptomyces sp. HPF1205 TaxID=2873262 RepID=UPI001CED1DB6|nr:hypothetical protein [Streptomyces sp. HPF1205]
MIDAIEVRVRRPRSVVWLLMNAQMRESHVPPPDVLVGRVIGRYGTGGAVAFGWFRYEPALSA